VTPRWEARADLVVVGSGVAGLTAALHARNLGLRVLVITKSAVDDCNTRWAQGGVAVVLTDEHEQGDTVWRHISDTVAAGAGLCEPDMVASILAAGSAAVTRLRDRGAQFDTYPDGRLARAREGGHSAARIIRAGGDATGAEVARVVVAAGRVSGIPVLEGHVTTEVLVAGNGSVAGVVVLDSDNRPGMVRAPAVLLATGGIGHLYEVTSNPPVATADGLALALHAGARIADAEFVQFHPTVLYTGRAARGRAPLVTEAIRGEGAVLVDATGARVMAAVHPLEDLAPRDVVAAAITRRMAQAPGGVDDHVFLDATHLPTDVFRRRFPTLYSSCFAIGIDPAADPIPVAPAAHYHCGGVMVDHLGRTDVPGLYAAGELARTGLNGASRLASNSLLEGLVLGERVAAAAAATHAPLLDPVPSGHTGRLMVPDLEELRRLMSRYLAIGRDKVGLEITATWIAGSAVQETPAKCADHESAALTLAARIVVAAATERRESRGCHVRTDFPLRDDAGWRRSLVLRLDGSGEPKICAPISARGAA
jgi:L-aspartate oxidase